jgi:predicted RecA/RadA family phage recombinase
MKNFLGEGKSLTFTADGTYGSGDGVVLTDRAGIAAHDAVSGEKLEVLVEGLVRYAKTSVALSVGEKLYYDDPDDNVQATADSGTNKPIGWAASDQASGDSEVDVKLGAY